MTVSSTLTKASRHTAEASRGDLRRSEADQPALRRHTRVARSRALMASRMRRTFGARAPHVDAGEQEDPHHVDEVPVPGSELETEVLRRREMAEIRADQADDQERGTDDHVRAVETGRHEE